MELTIYISIAVIALTPYFLLPWLLNKRGLAKLTAPDIPIKQFEKLATELEELYYHMDKGFIKRVTVENERCILMYRKLQNEITLTLYRPKRQQAPLVRAYLVADAPIRAEVQDYLVYEDIEAQLFEHWMRNDADEILMPGQERN